MTRSFDVAVRSLLSRAEVLSGRRERDQDIHRTVQARLRRKYATFRAEAVLSVRVQAGDSEVRVTGRVDGYRRSRRGLLLYEIKSVPSHPHRWLGHPLLEPAREQLRLYADLSDQATTRLWGDGPIVAAILLLSDGRRTVMEEVSLSSPPGLVARRATHWMAVSSRTPFQSASELERFVEGDRQADRAEQREACERLQRSLERVGRVLLTMPPGTGKTRVALRAGLLRAKQCGCRLYWITTKSRGRDEVLAEVQRYLDAGIPLRVLWKTSAERTCQCGREAASCPVKLDTHRDLFSAGLPRLVHGPRWSFSDLAAHAQSSSLCLHELSAQAEELADVVIADANYLLERSTVDRKAVFVADEAQNLVERCRALVETCLTTSDLRSVMSTVPAATARRLAGLGDPAWWEEEAVERIRNAWNELAMAASFRTNSSPVIAAIQRSASLWNEFPESFLLRWVWEDGAPQLIGTMLDWEPFLSRPFGRAAAVVALSGSLPRLSQVRRFLFPLTGSFDEVRVRLSVSRPVRIVPLLDFKHPLSLEDHEAAADCAREIRECYGPTVLVFGQNRASNELLAWRLRVRGFSAVLDEDLDENWSGLCENKPDFLFVPLGGNLTESVNPPPQSLSAAIVISPGHRPPQLHDRLRAAMQQQGEDVGRTSGVLRDERIAAAVSRVVQAAGRVQRSTQSVQPVFLLNKDFARPDYLTAWPEDWYRNRADEIVCASLSDAIASLDGVHDQK